MWCLTPLVRGWHLLKTPRLKLSRKVKRLVKSLLQPSGLTQSRRSQKWGVRLSKAVCSRPLQPTRIRNRTLRRSARPPSCGLTREYRGRRRRSLPPIRFTGCQENVDAFAHETGHLLSKLLRVLPHQSSHQHWEQNEVHENLRGGEASLGAERPLWTALKGVGRIVQDMRDGSCSPISACLTDMGLTADEAASLFSWMFITIFSTCDRSKC